MEGVIFFNGALRLTPIGVGIYFNEEGPVRKLDLVRILEVFVGVLAALVVYGFIGGSIQ